MFQEYLEEKCFEENPQVLDDDLSDFFSDWVSNLDVDKLIDYGDEAMKEQARKLLNNK